MDEDDLPPHPENNSDEGFSGALGRSFSGLLVLGVLFGVAGLVLYAATHWLH